MIDKKIAIDRTCKGIKVSSQTIQTASDSSIIIRKASS